MTPDELTSETTKVAKRVEVCVAAAATTMAVVSAPTAQAQPVDPVTVVPSSGLWD